LLARKGAARPAMRPQGFTAPSSNLDDLGWNDMGGDHPKLTQLTPMGEEPDARPHQSLGLSPVSSPVHSQQAELADRLSQVEDEEEVDEEYDETAEPYEPDGGSASFNGFDPSDEEDEGEAAEPEFKVQFKGGKKPLDLGPGPEAVAEPPVVEDVLDLVEPVAAVEVPAPSPVSAPAGRAKAAFTLRLDPQRHLKLRLACAVRGCSAQQLVTDALDRLLGNMPELDDMAEKARQRN
jgi:hypothetical protein